MGNRGRKTKDIYIYDKSVTIKCPHNVLLSVHEILSGRKYGYMQQHG